MIDLKILIPVAAFVAGLAAAGVAQGWRYSAYIAEIEASQAKVVAAAQAKAREIEQNRIKTMEGIAHDAKEKLVAAQSDAAAARGAADRLRQRAAEYARAAAENSPAADGGEATDDALFLLADVLGRADERAGELANFADAAHISGRACEVAYDAMRDAK